MGMGQYGNRKYKIPKRKKPKVPGAVVGIYVVMIILVLIICAIVFFVTLKNTGVLDSDSSSYEISSEISDSDPREPESSEDNSEASIDVNFHPAVDPEEFFENDLFIGDSIFTGLYLYEDLGIDMKNVAAATGYTPYKALNASFRATYSGSAADYAKELRPKRIYIMLGSNTMASGTAFGVIVSQYGTLIKTLKENCPDSKIYVISIPPVTADSSAASSAGITNENINTVNGELKAMSTSMNVTYYDFHSVLCDQDGCFNKDYAEKDGIHFKLATYKVLLTELRKLSEDP